MWLKSWFAECQSITLTTSGAVHIPTLPIPTVLSSYSRIAGLGWEPGYAVSYVSREAGKSCNYYPNMRCVQTGNMCEKYSEYAQICANNERKYAEICAHSGDMREKYAICLICCNMWENMRYAHLAKICGPEECAPHSRNRNCRNRECWNRNLYPPNYFSSPGPQTDTTTLQLVMRTDMTVYNIHQLQQRVPQQHHSRPLNTTVIWLQIRENTLSNN